MGSILVSLHIKGSLTGQSFAISRNQPFPIQKPQMLKHDNTDHVFKLEVYFTFIYALPIAWEVFFCCCCFPKSLFSS